MRRALAMCVLLGCGSSDPEPRVDFEQWCAADTEEVAAQVEAWMSDMTVEDKVRQLTGNALLQNPEGLWPTPTDELRGIPGFRMVDGPRGAHRATGDATAFPVGMARGATWDPALEERVGRAIGTEVKGKGANVLLAPTINILRHPLWGRAQETYGEDPHHMAMMGAAFVSGAQEQVVATAKHFAVNSIEDTRFDVNVQIDERSLHEVYLPHFRHLVQQAHVGSVMSAYNHVNGRPASEQPARMSGIRTTLSGFSSFAVSAMKCTPASTITSASVSAARRANASESPVMSATQW